MKPMEKPTTNPKTSAKLWNDRMIFCPKWPTGISLPLTILFLLVFLLGLQSQAAAQIVPRSSAWIMQETASSSEKSNRSFAVSDDEKDLISRILDSKERVTVSSTHPSSTLPKNAVLIDSFLLKSSRPESGDERRSLPTTSLIEETTQTTTPVDALIDPVVAPVFNQSPTQGFAPVATVVDTSTTTPIQAPYATTTVPSRQAKRGQTGRPNFFYLGEEQNEPDFDSAPFPSVEETQSDHNDILATTTPDPLASFYGGIGTGSNSRTEGRMTTGRSIVIQPEFGATLNWTNPSSRVPYPFVSSSIPPNAYRVTVPNRDLISGRFPAQDVPNLNRVNNIKSQFPAPTKTPNEGYESAVRRQGGVFNAPNPVQALTPDFSGRGTRPPMGVAPFNERRYPGPPQGDRRTGSSDPTENHDFSGMPPPFQARPGPQDNFQEALLDGGIKLETCSIGDDSTCTESFNEICRVDEDGAATCLCRLGSARLRIREQCRAVLSYFMYIRLNRLQDHELRYGPQFAGRRTRQYLSLERQVLLGVDSLMRATGFVNEYAGSKLNTFASISEDGLLANVTLNLFKSSTTTADPSNLPTVLQQTATEQLRLSQRRLGESSLYVGSLLTAIPGVQDINECLTPDLNDCPANASTCSNNIGSFSCTCRPGYGDRHASDPLRMGRSCETCEESYCNQHGICLLDSKGQKVCQCNGWYIGTTCQTDGQVVAVACGSSAIAVILIAITLVFLLRWSRSSASSRGDPSSTLGRSEISANTFTYVKNSPPLTTLSQASLENKVRMAYLVHPSLLTASQRASHHHHHGGSDQLLDSNFYEVRPPPGRLGPSQALIAAEMMNLYRQQRSGSQDHLTNDLSSLDEQGANQRSPMSSS
ncbi:hypothetical protein BV898_02731 [Hypsibius exemplaris]|uniref:63 kDa sperm flagellar membrane protein n=1 Tax=Hypsibius exemplaris TaxID=2072580 RepID=A0A1W0X7C2_HYPEX|nr:hypothetical protein BV898_02731 [Hypsibius exemplaris]